ncbi:MAG: SHOCT domain-containing protein [Chloroflexi bacterium]|nr:SHOCT domain-containing protein [Chloroflexota bacterium]
MMGYGFDGGGGGWLWMLGGLLLMVGLVVLIVWAVGAVSRGGAGREPERTTALDILRERFARGEITQAEFEQAKKALGY